MGFKTRRFRTRVVADDQTTATGLAIPFDPREVFGKARAPVVVEIGAHRYRTTTATMGGRTFVPLSRANREAAGVVAGQRVEITMTLDEMPRVIEAPADLRRALRASPVASAAWERLSYTHRREHVEAIVGAARAETRARRVAKCIAMLGG